jgi:signal transduction histidine kinase
MKGHSARAKSIRIRTSIDGGMVRVEIRDNGPGISDEHLPHLFDSFFTTKQGGLGIGLSLCRSIIEAHGGQIGAANLPTGALLHFELPTAR